MDWRKAGATRGARSAAGGAWIADDPMGQRLAQGVERGIVLVREIVDLVAQEADQLLDAAVADLLVDERDVLVGQLAADAGLGVELLQQLRELGIGDLDDLRRAAARREPEHEARPVDL